MKKYILLFLLLSTITIACKKEKEAEPITTPQTPKTTQLIFINNGAHTLYNMDFNVRIYYPNENITQFVNKIGWVVPVLDSLLIEITEHPYKDCQYQYMLYWQEKVVGDSVNNVQYRSYTDTLKETQYKFIIDWPKDSILFEKIH